MSEQENKTESTPSEVIDKQEDKPKYTRTIQDDSSIPEIAACVGGFLSLFGINL